MRVSIIICVYNSVETIFDAISSALFQNYDDIEYVVIDAGSSDGSLEIVKGFGDKIDILISEPDEGIYDGLNKGISLSTGGVICFLHSDDLYADNNVVRKVISFFDANENLDGVYGDLVYTPQYNTNKILRYWKSKSFDIALLERGWMPAHPTLFLRKEVYDKYGKFDLDFKIAADYDFMLRILRGGIEVMYISEVLYKMRVGGESNKSLVNIIQKSKEDLKALRKNNIGGLYSLIRKNFSKISQFFHGDKNL